MNETLKSKKSNKPLNKRKIVLISVICGIAGAILVLPLMTVIVYESIFGARYQTASWMSFSVDEFEGLSVERSDFSAEDDVTLAGYKYSKGNQEAKGVVVLAHGIGSGHNYYMPFIDYFTSNGYYVFAYDAHGSDNSGGESVEGLPQGVADLDLAITHLSEIPEYSGLPIVLFGHSWGAYSVGNVLNLHPEVKAAVMVAGFNESEDMLLYQSRKYVGPLTTVLLPYVELYEEIKFGSYAKISALEGMKNSEAGIMIVQSKDDATVPTEFGYDKFYSEFANDERFEFVLYEDKGHKYVFFSDEALDYQEQLGEEYDAYIEQSGKRDNSRTEEEFMLENIDKEKCFEPDPVLMEQIIEMYDSYCK